ncbi:MAG: amino acid permease, partial [Paludibacter sp.]
MKTSNIAILLSLLSFSVFSQSITNNLDKQLLNRFSKTVTVYSSASNTNQRLTETAKIDFKKASQPFESEISVFVNPHKSFQTVLGIGGAITDASAETFAKLSTDKKQELIDAYYNKTKGIGYTLARTNINSCDFSSGSYSYIETAFGKYFGFLTANIFIFGAAIMANAAVANGLADTIAYFLPAFKLHLVRFAFFAVIFGGLAYLNIRGVKKAITIVKINTIAKLIPLVMISVLGWFYFNSSDINFSASNTSKDIGEISLILLFAFVGAETALNVSGEIKNPEKTIPLGIMISMLTVVVLY